MSYQQMSRTPTKTKIELQINISIGKRKYVLQVEKGAQLISAVHNFLNINDLNINYQGPILAMVREELAKKQSVRVPEIADLQKIKKEIDEKKKSLLMTKASPTISKAAQSKVSEGGFQSGRSNSRINKQNIKNSINSNSDEDKIVQKQRKSKSPSLINGRKQVKAVPINLFPETGQAKEQQDPCKDVYEKWKVKEKVKQAIKNKSPRCKGNQQRSIQKKSISINKNKSSKKIEIHEPDYFYKRGIKFNEQKQASIDQMYHKNYPFRTSTESTLTPRKKNQLHERLHREKRIKEASLVKRQVDEKMNKIQKKPTYDKYKQKVKERDQQLNQVLEILVGNGMIQNPYKIQRTSKSPFRKTTMY